MTIALLTNIISPHRIPLSHQLAAMVGHKNYRYYYTEPLHSERAELGWCGNECHEWCVPFSESDNSIIKEDLFVSGLRRWDLLLSRAGQGLPSIYASERWFKPSFGFWRIFVPSYYHMAAKFVGLLSSFSPVYYFPQGVHAARDMARLCGLLHGDWRCLFRAPKLAFEMKPCGRIWLKNRGDDKRYCLDKMRMWGYFVEPSQYPNPHSPIHNSTTLKVLWVGRLLHWKRVDTIIRAVGELARPSSNSNSNSNSHSPITLDIYGIGPEENRLKKLAAKYGDHIKFHQPVSISEVRKLMKEHDVYVLASNGYEGWGAVVSEALEEGMRVIGTCEAGSSATMLPETNLFHAGDWRRLANLLASDVPQIGIDNWSSKEAAQRLLAFYEFAKEHFA